MYNSPVTPVHSKHKQVEQQRSYLQEQDDEDNELLAINDATRVISDLPTQIELEDLLDQNKKLLQLWKSSQSHNKEIQLQLNDTHGRLRSSQWERGARERLEKGLEQSTGHPNSMVQHMQHEFTYILSPREVVHLYLVDHERLSLVCCGRENNYSEVKQLAEVPLDANSNVVKSYLSGAVIWSSNSDIHPTARAISEHDVEAMAAVIVWVPLKAEDGIDCCGVAKVMYSNLPNNVVVESSNITDLGKVGRLCQIIGGLCHRHYHLWASQQALTVKEQHLQTERLDMVNFLRHDWCQLDGMFELKRQLKEAVATSTTGATTDNITAAAAMANVPERIATMVEGHLMKLLGKNEFIGLYLPPEEELSNMAGLRLVHVTRQNNMTHSYTRGRDYLNHEEILAIVRYVGSTETVWNSSSSPQPVSAPYVSSSVNNVLAKGSLLCIPIVGSKCVGVLCVWRPVTSELKNAAPQAAAITPTSTTTMDELDEHTAKTYCKHLADLIEVDLLHCRSDFLKDEQARRSVSTSDILSEQLSQRLSIFSSKHIFFHQVSAGLKQLIGTEAAYLFVLDTLTANNNDNNDNNNNNNEMWTVSCASQASEQIITLTSNDLSNTVMGEVVRTEKAVVLDAMQCRDDSRCTNIDGVPVHNLLCVPLYVQHNQPEKNTTTWHAVQSRRLGGLIVFLNKTVLSGVVNFVAQDLVVANQASRVVAPLVQAWLHNSKADAREEMIDCENMLNQDKLSDVITGSLQLMRTAQSTIVFVSAATTACFAVFGSSCSIELLLELNDGVESNEGKDSSGSNSLIKFLLSEKLGGGELEQKNTTTEDERNVRDTVRYGRCNVSDPSIAVCFRIEASGGSTEGDDDEENDEDITCVLKIVCANKSKHDFNTREETFLQQLSLTCQTTTTIWMQNIVADSEERNNDGHDKKHQPHLLHPELMEEFNQLSSCNALEDLCVAVNQLSTIIPGRVALLLPEPKQPDTFWSAIPSSASNHGYNHNKHERVHVRISKDNHPHGIIGSVIESRTDMFVSDVRSHRDFRSESDSHEKISMEKIPDSYSVIPMLDQNGSVNSVLQIFPTKRKKTKTNKPNKNTRNKFARADKQLWKTIATFIHTHVDRVKKYQERKDKLAQLQRQNEQLNKKSQYNQKLVVQCTQAMHRAQNNSYSDRSSTVLFNLQRDLCQAFDFVCVALFVQLDSEKDEIKTALKTDSRQTENNNYMYSVPSTSIALRGLFGNGNNSVSEIKVVESVHEVRVLLDDIPHVSDLPASFVPNSKVVVCIHSKIVGGTSMFVAVVDQNIVTEDLLSNVNMLCTPAINAACSTVVAMDTKMKLEETERKLKIMENKCQTRNSLHNAMLACKSTSSLRELVVIGKQEAAHLFDIEAADFFVLDNERNMFWTLDTAKDGGIDQREIAAGEGGVLGSLSLALVEQGAQKEQNEKGELFNTTRSENSNAMHKLVCFTSNVRSVLARDECPSQINAPLSVLMVPITTVEGHLLGAIELTNRRGGTFTPEDQEIAIKFTDQLGHTMESYQMLMETTKKTEQATQIIEKQQLEVIDLKHQLTQISLQFHASSSVLSSLSYLRIAQPQVLPAATRATKVTVVAVTMVVAAAVAVAVAIHQFLLFRHWYNFVVHSVPVSKIYLLQLRLIFLLSTHRMTLALNTVAKA